MPFCQPLRVAAAKMACLVISGHFPATGISADTHFRPILIWQFDGRPPGLAACRARRLKDSYHRLWTQGTEFLPLDRFQGRLTSRQLKVKIKANNIAGLQLADLLAHPSRNEILKENNLLEKPIAPFARQVIEILQAKYYQRGGKVFGKKML